MQITNNHNLPQSLYNALSAYNKKPEDNRFSVTDLINPPQIRYLKMLYWDELQDDASSRIWALLGQAPHYILHKHSPEDALSEEKLIIQCDGYTIVGMADLWQDKEITDWKITSVYAFLLGDKPEWEKQLNLYALLYRRYGFEVDKLTIYAILRDWQKGKSHGDGYPDIPFMAVDIPLWTESQQEQFLYDCLADHNFTVPRLCTPEEQWARPTQYAVMKEGRKRAIRVLDTLSEAYIAMGVTSKKDKCFIQERPGARVRCQDYCPVREVCPQKKSEESDTE